MKIFHPKIEKNPFGKNNVESPEEKEMKLKMEDFYKRHFESNEAKVKKISLDALRELKEKGITTEKFLDYLCQQHGVLLHGSIHEISGDKLKSSRNKIFASNKAAIAIMKSMYSTVKGSLGYP